MLLIFPLFCGGILLLQMYLRHRSITRAVVDTIIVMMAISVAIAEITSLFTGYNTVFVSIGWIVALTVASIWFVRCYRRLSIKMLSQFIVKDFLKRISWLEWLMLGAIAIMFVALIIKAFHLGPAYPVDSIQYHMTRALMYYKNQSIHNYAVSFGHHVFFAPFNGILISQIMILFGGKDVFSFLVQFAGLGMSIVAMYLIGKEFDLPRIWCLAAATFTCFVPLCVIQATTTQNDLILTGLCLVAVFYMIHVSKTVFQKAAGINKLYHWVLLGLSCGLCVLTKVNAGLILGVFVLVFSGYIIIKQGKKGFIRLLLVAFCAIIIPLGFWIRNAIILNGDFLALSYARYAPSQDMTPAAYGLLALENYATTFSYPTPTLNKLSSQIVETYAGFFGLNVNMSGVNRGDGVFSPRLCYTPDDCPYPVLSLTAPFVALLLLGMFLFSKKKNYIVLIYNVIAIITLLLTLFSLTYSSSSSRYLLTPFLFFVPTMMWLLHKISANRKWIAIGIASAIILLSIWNSVDAFKKDIFYLVPSADGTGAGKATISSPSLYTCYNDIMNHITENDYRTIGIYEPSALVPYSVLRGFADEKYTLKYAEINTDWTRDKLDTSYIPQALICSMSSGEFAPPEDNELKNAFAPDELTFRGAQYKRVLQPVMIFPYAKIDFYICYYALQQ